MRPPVALASGAVLLAGCYGVGFPLDIIGQALLSSPGIGWPTGGSPGIYCQQDDRTLYQTSSRCRDGDRKIKSWEYQRIAADQRLAKERAERNAAAAKAAEPVYCLTAISHSAYRAPSGACQADEARIDHAEYDRIRADPQMIPHQ